MLHGAGGAPMLRPAGNAGLMHAGGAPQSPCCVPRTAAPRSVGAALVRMVAVEVASEPALEHGRVSLMLSAVPLTYAGVVMWKG